MPEQRGFSFEEPELPYHDRPSRTRKKAGLPKDPIKRKRMEEMLRPQERREPSEEPIKIPKSPEDELGND